MNTKTWERFVERLHLQKFLKALENPTFQAVVIFFQAVMTFFAALATILAVILAIVAIDHADKQFVLNSESSDRLFNLQLKDAKELNDSLIAQVQRLQKVTERQLAITDEQLRISKEVLNEQIYSGRPKIVVMSDKLEDTSTVLEGNYSPKIITTVKNIGKRFAKQYRLRPFALDIGLAYYRGGVLPKSTMTIEPEKVMANDFLPKLSMNCRNEFFYVYEVSYYDDVLKMTFKQSYFHHYYRMRNVTDFFSCDNNEKEALLPCEWVNYGRI